jgi:hypothetical protein
MTSMDQDAVWDSQIIGKSNIGQTKWNNQEKQSKKQKKCGNVYVSKPEGLGEGGKSPKQ